MKAPITPDLGITAIKTDPEILLNRNIEIIHNIQIDGIITIEAVPT